MKSYHFFIVFILFLSCSRDGIVLEEITYIPSGPIVLNDGDFITGLAISNPDGPCIYGINVSNIIIRDNKIGPCGETLEGNGITLEQSSGVLVEDNEFDDIATAFYVLNSYDNIVFKNNVATRIRGPYPRGQLVQFNNVSGRGNKIICNTSNQTNPSYTDNGKYTGVEDHINIYESNGEASSNIEIAYNNIKGGGPSVNGGGILAADEAASYINVHHNNLVDPGQYGVAAATGEHITLDNNKIFTSQSYSYANIGMYVWNQYASNCDDITATNNQIYYIKSDDTLNPFWDAGNCTNVTVSGNTLDDLSLDSSIFETTYSECN